MKSRWMRIFVAFLPVWVFSAFFKFGGGLHYAVLSPLGEQVLPLPFVGIVIGIEAFAQMMLDVPAGFLVDRFGSVRMLKYSTVFFLVAAAVLACFNFSLPVYLTTLAISTFGWLFYSPGLNAYVLSHATEHEAGEFLSMRDKNGRAHV